MTGTAQFRHRNQEICLLTKCVQARALPAAVRVENVAVKGLFVLNA